MDQFIGPDTNLGKALGAPGGAFTRPDSTSFNTRAVRAAEIPAANGVTDARSLARMYAPWSARSTASASSAPTSSSGHHPAHVGPEHRSSWTSTSSSGSASWCRRRIMRATRPGSFGHYGVGGSVGWADPEAELGFGYVMNRMDIGLAGDMRSTNLMNAVYASL